MTCKWLSDNYSQVCTNAECPVCGNFCPFVVPDICKYYAERSEENGTSKDM